MDSFRRRIYCASAIVIASWHCGMCAVCVHLVENRDRRQQRHRHAFAKLFIDKASNLLAAFPKSPTTVNSHKSYHYGATPRLELLTQREAAVSESAQASSLGLLHETQNAPSQRITDFDPQGYLAVSISIDG